jgi:DNA processing protein
MPAVDVDLVALALLQMWRGRGIAQRLRAGDTPAAVLRDECAANPGRKGRSSNPETLRERAAAGIARGARAGLHAVLWTDDAYPPSLLTIVDPPLVLWVRGRVDVLSQPAVAIVGSRAGTPYALDVAARLATDLASHGIVIVSGLARGVDSAAHRGALAGSGLTAGILGCGADVMYPREHARLASDIAAAGAVVSELLPGTPPQAPFFPLRNRIISGLSRAVVVVEAGEKSGSLITARCALEQGRDVLAVPGNVLSGRNRGGHALLRDGARLVESADDVLEELAMTRKLPRKSAGPGAPGADPWFDQMIPGEPTDLDHLCQESGLSSPRLLARLFELEIVGSIRRVGGGRFVRLDSSC